MMTDEMMSLHTLLKKSADANLLCRFQRKAATSPEGEGRYRFGRNG
jgi:hypothetical protein